MSAPSPKSNSGDETPPPLPPRPAIVARESLSVSIAQLHTPSKKSLRPTLQSNATTALSLTDINTQSYLDGTHETYLTTAGSNAGSVSGQSSSGRGKLDQHLSRHASDTEDTGSIRSYAPTLEADGDVESLLGEVLGSGTDGMVWKLLNSHEQGLETVETLLEDDGILDERFDHEFDSIDELKIDGTNEESLMNEWKSRLKHFIILSSAGKPIYTRHGDANFISGYVGVIQTILSFYHDVKDPLKGFIAGDTRFVFLAEGSLYLVAISRLEESEAQLRAQLDALYMQILSTLTLPTLTRIFSQRASADLRRPLQGTEPLLSGLADTFTKGSPSTLLSALECLRLRKSHRQLINNTFIKSRTPKLLYGLIVASGRLVSVVRPKKHSLHPGDLQLIFNMLFEAEGVKAGGGENWIPLCLPGFNKTGYLYMYVSFLSAQQEGSEPHERPTSVGGRHDEIATILISTDKEAFFELKDMRADMVRQLEKNGTLAIIKATVKEGRPATTDIVPGTVLRHFLYKSRANVQFAMPAFSPHFTTPLARRKLVSLYHSLHASVHSKNSHLKVQHCVFKGAISLAWITPIFELYCVAGSNTSRTALAASANKIVQWARREEERIFIIGGAVF